jgi:triphosphoribosyl-dephospho-CoA synthase
MLDLCEEVAYILANSSMTELEVFKPGNVSRFQDLKNTNFSNLSRSILLLQLAYRECCVKGILNYNTIFDSLYKIILISKKLKIKFDLLGTGLLMLPISYTVLKSNNLTDLRKKLGEVVKKLGKRDAFWFINSLKIINPSYLGKLHSNMDYEKILTNLRDLYSILLYSSKEDSVSRNMINNYEYTYIAYKIIKENKCGFYKDIQKAFIKLLSEIPDGLIYRKHGGVMALKVSKLASTLVTECPKDEDLRKLNEFLVSNNLNPGSTADIIASAIAFYYLEEWYENSFNIRHAL